MSSQVYTTPYTNRNPSADGTQKRTFHDAIRNLFPGASTLLALVAHGKIEKGQLTKGKGMISKTSTSTRRYEFGTYTPLTVQFTVDSVDANGKIVIAGATTGMVLKRAILNTENMDVGRISSINAATKVITVTPVTSSFNVAAGDKLLLMAAAYEEGSSNPYRIMKDFDTNYNVCQIMRYPVSIAASAKGTPHYGVKDFFSRIKENNVIEGNILTEHTMLFGERATLTTTDLISDSTLGDSFGMMRGLWNWAATTFDCGGAMTPDKFRTNLALALPNTISSNQKVVMLTSRDVFAEMTGWIYDKYMVTESGDMKKFGVKSEKFMTAGPDIEVIQHAAFDRGSLRNKAIIFCPEDVLYVAREGRDLQPRKGIGDNSFDGYEDEIFGELTIAELTGGYNVMTVENWFTL